MAPGDFPAAKRQKTVERVTVLGAGFSGLTTAAELALRGHRVRVIAKDFGYCPPITICGTQSRRHPGIAWCNRGFDKDDLLDKELVSLNRFLALSVQNPESGVSVIPALKVSRKEGAWWNPRPLDKERKAKATEVQNCLRMAAKPTSVDPALKERLLTVGYKSVDETQVVKVESRKYFDFLVDLIKSRGGCVCIGCKLDAEAVANMSGLAVVNCLGLEAGKVGGNGKEYENNPGEEVIFHKSPCAVPFYIIDDDTSGTIVQGSDGQLCLSSGAKPQHLLKGKGGYDDSCSKQTVEDASLLQVAIFGDAQALLPEDISESWATDRPSLGTGFNVGAERREDGQLIIQNSGHGGAGVTASWACAILAADAMEVALKAV